MEEKTQVLIVEDDPDIQRLVERSLANVSIDGFAVSNNREALAAVEQKKFDIALVDLGLPDGDGLGLARTLSMRDDMGVIILTGRGDVTDKVVGLEIGADDYVTKPFEQRELVARVKSVARRLALRQQVSESTPADTETLVFNGWSLDDGTMRITHADGRSIDLSSSEYSLLRIFLDHAGRVLTRDQIMDFIFDQATPAFDRSIDIRVSRLRAKIEDNPRQPKLIVTARNLGYVFRGKIER